MTHSSNRSLKASILGEGFAFVQSAAMRGLLAPFGPCSDWSAFAESWNALELDTDMSGGGPYRRRRHAVYGAARNGPIQRQPHQPHFQSLDCNPLHGGGARWFEPIEPEVGGGSSMQTILGFCRALFDALAAHAPAWRIEVHQFRIEARPGEQGMPTPEGPHRDGVDYVLELLVNHCNIASATTSVHALDGRPLGQFTLTEPFDAALVDDSRVARGVMPVERIDLAAPAHRDVLLVTFTSEQTRAVLSVSQSETEIAPDAAPMQGGPSGPPARGDRRYGAGSRNATSSPL